MAQVVQYLWGLVNSLQVMVLVVLFELHLPMLIYSTLISIMQLTNLSLIDTDEAIEDMFSFQPTEALNERFDEAGYGSTNFFILLGIFLFMSATSIFWMLLRKLCQRLLRNVKSDCWAVKLFQAETHYKKALIIFIDESCIELSLSAAICIKSITAENFSHLSDAISTCMALLVGPIILIVPLYLIKAKQRYQEEIFIRKTNKFYEDFFPGLRGEEPLALYYNTVFLFRRMSIVSVLVLNYGVYYSILAHTILNLVHASYVFATKPFDSASKNNSECFNEIMVLLSTYFLFTYTSWISDLDLLDNISLANVAVLAVTFIINSIIIIMVQLRNIRICCLKRKFKKLA